MKFMSQEVIGGLADIIGGDRSLVAVERVTCWFGRLRVIRSRKTDASGV